MEGTLCMLNLLCSTGQWSYLPLHQITNIFMHLANPEMKGDQDFSKNNQTSYFTSHFHNYFVLCTSTFSVATLEFVIEDLIVTSSTV